MVYTLFFLLNSVASHTFYSIFSLFSKIPYPDPYASPKYLFKRQSLGWVGTEFAVDDKSNDRLGYVLDDNNISGASLDDRLNNGMEDKFDDRLITR